MNNLQNQTVAIFYDSAKSQDVMAAAVAIEATGLTPVVAEATAAPFCLLYDINGDDDTTTSGDVVYDWIVANMTTNTYDYIVVCCTYSDTGGTSDLQTDTIALLRTYLKTANQGTTIDSGTSAAGTTSSITLAAGYVATADYHNGLHVESTGGTGAANIDKVIIDDDGSGVCSVGGANWTSPSNDTTYVVRWVPNLIVGYTPTTTVYGDTGAYMYDAQYSNVERHASVGTANYNKALMVWKRVHGTQSAGGVTTFNTPPQIINMTSVAEASMGVVTSAGNTTLSDTGNFVADAHIGQYVYIYDLTGTGQWARVVSNTANQLTCENFNGAYTSLLADDGVARGVEDGAAAWTTNPTAGSLYVVCSSVDHILSDMWLQGAIMVYLPTLTNATMRANWKRLLNDTQLGNDIANYATGAPVQDTLYLQELMTNGKAIYEAVGITGFSAYE